MNASKSTLRAALVLALAALLYGVERLASGPAAPTHSQPRTARRSAAEHEAPDAGARVIADAFREHRSDLWVETAGVVERILPDDRSGSRHQRFLLRLEAGPTLLVVHNIDLAPRVPLAAGDPVRLRGEYQWSERGGVLHWTHHDPDGRTRGGWIRHHDKVYQ